MTDAQLIAKAIRDGLIKPAEPPPKKKVGRPIQYHDEAHVRKRENLRKWREQKMAMTKITADAEQLRQDAITVATTYLHAGLKAIDETFEEDGYARKHPELMNGFLHAAAVNYKASLLVQAIQELTQKMEDAMEKVADTLDDMRLPLSEIARAMEEQQND